MGGCDLSCNFGSGSIVYAANAAYSAVVSPSGPSQARISCAQVPLAIGGSLAAGMAGIWVTLSSHFLLDGVTVDSCGFGTGNVIVRGSPSGTQFSYVEIANSVINNSRSRGIWQLTMGYVMMVCPLRRIGRTYSSGRKEEINK
jgi:hypothetical protein